MYLLHVLPEGLQIEVSSKLVLLEPTVELGYILGLERVLDVNRPVVKRPASEDRPR